MATVATRGIQLGTYAVNIKYAVQMFNGYLQIQKKGYQENPTLNKSFKLTPGEENILKSNSKIIGYAPRVYADGLIGFNENTQGAMIFGIDPAAERRTSKILTKLKAGKFFNSDTTDEIVLAYKLMDNLKVNIGDTVVVLAQGYDGTLGNLKFVVTGKLKFGSSDIDAMGAFIGLSTAQDLLSMYKKINSIAINLKSLDDIKDVKSDLTRQLPDTSLAVLDWEELMPDFKQSIDLDNVSGKLMLLILVIIVAFGILNTVLMSVTERFNEFGVTLAIGMPQIKLVYLVLLETFFITIIGILLGDLLGYFINLYIIHNPIEFAGNMGKIYEEYGFLPRIESTLEPDVFINTSLIVFIISTLATIYPLYKVFKLEPLKGIRYT